MQLAGNLHGKALQEWNLCSGEERSSHENAIHALCKRFYLHNCVLGAHELCHTTQADGESVTEYIRRIERIFR